jgi:hypothetical protein
LYFIAASNVRVKVEPITAYQPFHQIRDATHQAKCKDDRGQQRRKDPKDSKGNPLSLTDAVDKKARATCSGKAAAEKSHQAFRRIITRWE